MAITPRWVRSPDASTLYALMLFAPVFETNRWPWAQIDQHVAVWPLCSLASRTRRLPFERGE